MKTKILFFITLVFITILTSCKSQCNRTLHVTLHSDYRNCINLGINCNGQYVYISPYGAISHSWCPYGDCYEGGVHTTEFSYSFRYSDEYCQYCAFGDTEGSEYYCIDLARTCDDETITMYLYTDCHPIPEPPEKWTVIRIIDKNPPDDLTLKNPGAEIDKISVEDEDGNIVACGCPVDVALAPYPPEYPASSDNWHNDVNDGRNNLCTKDSSVDQGYVSLGGSNLLCDIGKPLKDGYHILISEIRLLDEPRSDSPFAVNICQTMNGPCLDHYNVTDPSYHDDIEFRADFIIDEGF